MVLKGSEKTPIVCRETRGIKQKKKQKIMFSFGWEVFIDSYSLICDYQSESKTCDLLDIPYHRSLIGESF